ncbi:MAG: FAD-dependent oxidoreductase [Candidatus Binatia bacterium]
MSSTIRDTRGEQIFPHLNPHQLGLLEGYGERRRYPAGAVLFAEGSRHVDMFVVLSGLLDIVRQTKDGEELIVTHDPGSFTGEVGQLGGRAAIGTARVRADCEVLVIPEAGMRRLVVADAELSELIMRAFILRRVALIEDIPHGVTMIGSHQTAATHRLRQFLTLNGQPHVYLDVEHDQDTAALMLRFGVGAGELPVILLGDGRVLRTPSNRDLADHLGLGPERLDGRQFDLAVVGAGPAGLAAAVYAASEGLSVVVLDANAPGGQAGTSSRIENYFGFPTGITGKALAGRGFVQAQKFGAEVAVPRQVLRLDCNHKEGARIELDAGERLSARAVVIASGARYRKLELANLAQFEGRGVYYGAAFNEAQMCANQEVIVVGGGNSAGQAAVFLSAHAKHVHVLVRGPSLAASMSNYLIQRIEAAANITLHTETEIIELAGDQELARVRWQHRRTQAIEDRALQHVFLFCGADPNTAWVADCIVLDAAGFVKTGAGLSAAELQDAEWPLARAPLPLETSWPGVFAVGDVRSGSVKRVAAAVGEGSTAVQLVHMVLAATT